VSERLDVAADGPLLVFLRERLDGWRVKTLKARLRQGCIQVNGVCVTRHDHALRAGDCVEVGDSSAADRPLRGRTPFTVLFADADLIAIDKPPGLLSVSTDLERKRTALAMMRDSLSTSGRREPLWPVHRLDRETSGVLLFARSREMCEAVQANWTDAQKLYLAIVEGHPEPPEGVVDQPLWQDRSLAVHVGDRPGAKTARSRYRTRERARTCTLLEVELDTGRRHQIRCHMAWLGHPVVGDKRYGRGGPRMGLHARRLSVMHPRLGRVLTFETEPPPTFKVLFERDR
jgi:23S rRNA pseudouridine1911/1915/1917 synthase